MLKTNLETLGIFQIKQNEIKEMGGSLLLATYKLDSMMYLSLKIGLDWHLQNLNSGL
jgi:hypothetical protein